MSTLTAKSPTAGEVRRSIRTFRDYSSDLVRSDFDTFADRLKLLIHFCESDSTFSSIHEQLMTNPRVDGAKWIAESLQKRGRMGLSFPVDTDDRISLMYQLLEAGADNPRWLIDHLGHWFSISARSVSLYIAAFSDAVMQPLFRELEYRLEDIETQLPTERDGEVSASLFQIIHNNGSIVQQIAHGGAINQNATIEIKDERVLELFAELQREISGLNLSSIERKQADEILTSVKGELTSETPKATVVKALLLALPFAASVANLTTQIIQLISN